MELFDILVSLLALILLEIVLGIDNLVFLAILSDKLPKEKRRKARRWGLTFAWVTRLLLLASAVWITRLTIVVFSVFGLSFSIRDLFLILGGLFLIAKSTDEIHQEVGDPATLVATGDATLKKSFWAVVAQIALMDIIFSLDSVLTAIGLTNRFWVMAVAISCAIWIMIYASEMVSNFIEKHPSLKMLALTFLVLIGTVLIADGFSFHIPRGYIYFSMGFSLAVEALNIIKRSRMNYPKR